jgi:hypothetical protein
MLPSLAYFYQWCEDISCAGGLRTVVVLVKFLAKSCSFALVALENISQHIGVTSAQGESLKCFFL